MPPALGPAALGLWAYILGKSLMAMLQLLHNFTYIPLYKGTVHGIYLFYLQVIPCGFFPESCT